MQPVVPTGPTSATVPTVPTAPIAPIPMSQLSQQSNPTPTRVPTPAEVFNEESVSDAAAGVTPTFPSNPIIEGSLDQVTGLNVSANNADAITDALMVGAPMEIPYHPGVDSPQDQLKQSIMCAGGGYFCLLIGLLWSPAYIGAGSAFLLGIVLSGQARSTLLTYGHPTSSGTTLLWANWVGVALIPLLFIVGLVLFGMILLG